MRQPGRALGRRSRPSGSGDAACTAAGHGLATAAVDRRQPTGAAVAGHPHRGARSPAAGARWLRPQPGRPTAVQRSTGARSCAAKAEMFDDLVVVSGAAPGQRAARRRGGAGRRGIPLVVVLPYPDPDARWPAGEAHAVRRAAAPRRARWSCCRRRHPRRRPRSAAAMNRRDAWLARHSRRGDPGVGRRRRPAGPRCTASLVDHLGDDVVGRSNPGSCDERSHRSRSSAI